MVDKAAYTAWEAAVFKQFYTTERSQTPLIPTKGKPSVLSKEKFILVADACAAEGGGCMSDRVRAGGTAGLREDKHVQLWHLGKQKEDGVRFGLAAEEGLFKHPACDVGGLTNLKQKVGEAATFVGKPVPWGGAAAADAGAQQTAEAVAEAVLAQWTELTKRELAASLKKDVAKFLRTVEKAMGAVVLRFHLVPPEHRVIVTPADVKAATGKYLVRVFGGNSHAAVSDGKGLYCGVGERFVTPNLNEHNLKMEYYPYAPTATRPRLPALLMGIMSAGAVDAARKGFPVLPTAALGLVVVLVACYYIRASRR